MGFCSYNTYRTESLGATNIGPQTSQILHHTCSVWVAGPSKPAFSLPLETSLFPSASPLSLSPCCNNHQSGKCILVNWIPGKLCTMYSTHLWLSIIKFSELLFDFLLCLLQLLFPHPPSFPQHLQCKRKHDGRTGVVRDFPVRNGLIFIDSRRDLNCVRLILEPSGQFLGP